MSVKAPELRSHDDYFDKDVWKVFDVDSVDNLFMTRTDEDTVRIDLDGKAHPSNECVDAGERVNVSAWVDRETLLEFADKIREQEAPLGEK